MAVFRDCSVTGVKSGITLNATERLTSLRQSQNDRCFYTPFTSFIRCPCTLLSFPIEFSPCRLLLFFPSSSSFLRFCTQGFFEGNFRTAQARGSWRRKSPSGIQGGAPVAGLGDKVPQKLKHIVVTCNKF